MWILKGVGVGTALFLLFVFLYFRKLVRGISLPKDGTVGWDISPFIYGPEYWLLFILLVVSACFWFRLLEKVNPVLQT
jgi:hypothetical protein